MILYEDGNQRGYEAAETVFQELVVTSPPATPIERASILYGMQAFCRKQLKEELTSALDALECHVG